MNAALPQFWPVASFILHMVGAILCALSAGWVLHRGDHDRPDRSAIILALCLTSLWSAVVSALGPDAVIVTAVETLRNLAWIFVLYRLFANDGRDRSLAPIRRVVLALAFVAISQPALLIFESRFSTGPELVRMTFEIGALFHILVAIGALVLLHNLYGGASSATRQVLRWSAAGLGILWIFQLNYHTIAYLSGRVPVELAALSGIIVGIMAMLVALGSTRTSADLRLMPSRAVTFRFLSLLVIGAYLLFMVSVSQSIAMLGGDFARLTQVGFVFCASLFALVWLPSKRLRGWLRVTTVKHLFQHRYDYRAEWLRFTRTIGQSDDASSSLFERVVKSLADITDSPSGLLLLPDESGSFELAARWQWPDVEVPAAAMSDDLASLFESGSFVIDLDEVREGANRFGEAQLLPEWLSTATAAWALVPLLHFDRLTGVVVLSRPIAPRRLDWEDFDLLRVVGQQLASYLAEQSGHQALMESARFDEFNRRIAFVMHDIKNLASQLSLLARNAERHADNPDFRADMLVTLRNASDKLNGLLARLGRYGSPGSERREEVDLAKVGQEVARRYEGVHPVAVVRTENSVVLANPDALEQALVHLVQNGIEASPGDMPVFLDISSDGIRGRVDIIDSGTGMSPEFVRNGLFKPFVSSKTAGFGLGAFEARELVQAMGGRLDVESREGVGTRFTVQLPLAAITDLLARVETDPKTEVA